MSLICFEEIDGRRRWKYLAENEGSSKRFKKGSIRAVCLQTPQAPVENLFGGAMGVFTTDTLQFSWSRQKQGQSWCCSNQLDSQARYLTSVMTSATYAREQTLPAGMRPLQTPPAWRRDQGDQTRQSRAS
ncbi:uncharacterized protein LOC130778868 [Actinidia eriantha]|uniref:uncharacterized protein LOC130778868 n=1 Tax=Actinidia eriantha TaxID=165200 RepID=UPI0025846CEF|nr:uncharacterized protein LOC130778868 [Actinidia eriantha]